MRSKVEGAAVQRNEQGTTDAEADQKVSNYGEVEEMRRNEGGGSPPVTRVTRLNGSKQVSFPELYC